MGYSSLDSSLWWNMAGVVSAYQPVRAPGPLDALYNVAMGGTNKYRGEVTGTLVWHPANGWYHNLAGYVSSGVWMYDMYSVIVRYSMTTASDPYVIATITTDWNSVGCRPYYASSYPPYYLCLYWGAGNTYYLDLAASASGVIGLSKIGGYKNGALVQAFSANSWSCQSDLKIGGNWAGNERFAGRIQACAIYSRILSAAEMWQASRQMAYCDVNPEWNAWAVRRQWFFMAPAAAAYIPRHGIILHQDPGVV